MRRLAKRSAGAPLLTVALTGAGLGAVTSSDDRIACGSTCSISYQAGDAVVLTAAPAMGSTFVGWSGGGCFGIDRCDLRITSDIIVVPQFHPDPPDATISDATVDPEERTVTVQFSGSGQTSRFTCALTLTGNHADPGDCRSPQVFHPTRPGSYTLTVQAIGPGGPDPTPATRKLKVAIEFSQCWGAASRDPEHRCGNLALKHVVLPTPEDALLIPLGYCGGEMRVDGISMCSFGADAANARRTIGLIGDSHASAFLPAMNYAALADRWHGLAYIHNGCAFSDALMLVGGSYADGCHTWTQAVTRWLRGHPQVSTVVITG